MKQILITGTDSYIGNALKNWLVVRPESYRVDTLDVRDDSWRQSSFSGYDTVIHVAAIVHIKQTRDNQESFFRVNRDLSAAVAKRAKEAGVSQFVYLSSMSVYGLTRGTITRQTETKANSAYGASKLEAERLLETLRDEHFAVVLVRPPMVYGPGCKGNFQTIRKLALKLPVFPQTNNRRSLLYIDNLCEFLRLCVELRLDGLYFPQNRTCMNTAELARWIAAENGKTLHCSRLLGVCMKLLMPFSSTVRKAFGSLVYSDMEDLNFRYCLRGNEESVRVCALPPSETLRKGSTK